MRSSSGINALPPTADERLAVLADSVGKPFDYMRKAYQAACRKTLADERNVLARMIWPLSQKPAHFNLLEEYGDMDAEALAERILHPKTSVFEYIARRAPLDVNALEIVYGMVRDGRHSEFHDMLPDFTEERILQEMLWWLVDLGFPKYYFEVTPPGEIGSQIRINRFHEMYGIGSESYATLKISYRSPSGTSIHWVHK